MLPLGHMGIALAFTRVLERMLRIPRIDYRLLLIGAILPDLLDKSLSYLLPDGHAPGGRAVGHSVVFLLLLSGIFFIQRHKKFKTTHIETFLAGSAAHDLLDTMWLYPKIWFWPIGERLYDACPLDTLDETIRLGSIHITKISVFEFIGAGILLYYFIQLVRKSHFAYFIRTGKLSLPALVDDPLERRACYHE